MGKIVLPIARRKIAGRTDAGVFVGCALPERFARPMESAEHLAGAVAEGTSIFKFAIRMKSADPEKSAAMRWALEREPA